MFCSSCGAARNGPVCQQCGAGSTAPAPSRSSSTPLLLAAILGVLVIVVVLGAVVLLVGMPADSSDSGSTSASSVAPVATSSVTPSATPTPTATASVTPTVSGPGDVRALPAGLFCRDLRARGYSYSAAIDYWREHGQPNQMDVERNGIPCETVYPTSDVTAYWGPRPDADVVYSAGFAELPGGLFCRDLRADGLSYSDAVAYWSYWGRPDRMDADRDGIPCATVYPATDVDAYWG